jgi:serine/threonine protein kinase/Tol biopolymer transport system component
VTGTYPSEDWTDLASLVDALLDAAPERRIALIAELSAGDSGRRSALERLLRECELEPALFSRPAAERFAALFDDDLARFPDALGERYRFTALLGRGGMATVYLARDLKHARDVAVKVLHPLVASALGANRFLREIEIVAQLHHPHIVPLHDSGEADGSLYYVMPYEAGSSLRDRMARDGPLPVDDVLLILRDICDALAYAHQRGIVHRDVKPDNVLLSGRHAMLTDFGVAKAATEAAASATGAEVTLGTPAYMAPEQIAADPRIDYRADIYSLGVLAYELLAGRPPFEGTARQEILSAHLTAVPAPLATHRSDVPLPLAELVMKCLEKRPEDRWQGTDELVQRLENVVLSEAPALERSEGKDPHVRVLPFAPLEGRRFAQDDRRSRRRRSATAGALIAVVIVAVLLIRRSSEPDPSWRNRWANARIERLTDFPGSEVDAAISANGQLVAFLADRDSVFDAFVTKVGSGEFENLTAGRFPQLFNEDVRNIGFSADAAHVWIRVADITSPASVSIVPTEGGLARPFLKTAVMAVWSPDGSRLAYHETTPGDPIYVADGDGGHARRIFIATPDVHCHDLTWSPDGRFLYFSYGLPPNEMDIWRIPSSGAAAPERITRHDSRVAYPALLDDRTLVYTATADDGTGPWLYTMNVDDRIAHRVSTGVEHYVSISASAETPGQTRRLVATVSNPSVHLWAVPITNGVADERAASPLALPTARSAAPRFGRDSSLFYLASLGGADGLWRLSGTHATELWKSNQGVVVGAAAVSPDGKRVCFPVRPSLRSRAGPWLRSRAGPVLRSRAGGQARSTLYCSTAEGTGAQPIAESLDVRGAASWSPDGKWIAVGAREGPAIRVFKIPVGGGRPVRLVDSVSSNPVWSPDGAFILYSGTSRARSVPLRAITPDGQPYPLPALSVDRVGDSYRFLPDGKALVVKLGGFRRQDFWLFDVVTGRRRPLTALRPGESLQRFDVSPDGKRILFERMRENSDIVLIELPPR